MPIHQLIDAALPPSLGDKPHVSMARELLAQRVSQAAPDDRTVEQTISGFDRANRHSGKLRFWLKWALAAAVFLLMDRFSDVLEPLLPVTFPDSSVGLIEELRESAQGLEKMSAASVPPDRALLIHGDLSIKDPVMRAEDLWKNHYPDDPAIYYSYTGKYFAEHSELPSDFVQTAEMLDSGNGYAKWLKAATLAKSSVEPKPKAKGDSRESASSPSFDQPLREYEVTDPAAFDEAMRLFAAVATMPILDDRLQELAQRRFRGLPPPKGISGQLARCSWLLEFPVALRLSDKYLSYAICAKSKILEEREDREELGRLADQWITNSRRMLAADHNLIDALVRIAFIRGSGKQLMLSCRALGMDDQADQLERIVRPICELSDARRNPQDPTLPREMIDRQGSMLFRSGVATLIKQSAGGVKLDPRDMKPGRMAEWGFFDVGAAIIMGLLFLLCAMVSFFVSVSNRRANRLLSARFERLVSVGDWGWIIGLGILLPLAWVAVTTRVPWLHVRDYGMSFSLRNAGLLYGSIAVFLLFSLILTARWRVGLRAQVLGVPRPTWQWSAVAASALAIPAWGVSMFRAIQNKSYAGDHFLILPMALLSFAVLCGLADLLRAAVSKRSDWTTKQALCRVLVPGFCCASIVVVLAGLLAQQLEANRWAARDTATFPMGEYDGLSKYESLVAGYLKSEMLKAYGK